MNAARIRKAVDILVIRFSPGEGECGRSFSAQVNEGAPVVQRAKYFKEYALRIQRKFPTRVLQNTTELHTVTLLVEAVTGDCGKCH